jgi:DNA-binding NarL/FixJ family response regulator
MQELHRQTGGSALADPVDERQDRLRVIIADDDPLARRAVRDALQDAGITVIADATTGREAIELSVYYKPDVVVMDILMPDTDGIAATRAILARKPGITIVMLSSSEDDELGLLCLRAGAAGFLSKSVGVQALPRALRSARAGEAAISRRLTMRVIESMRRVREDGTGIRPVRSRLTCREWEVLDLLCQGKSTEDIAETLVLSSETVRSHVKHLLRKLGVRSRREAVEEAQRMRAEMIVPEREVA